MYAVCGTVRCGFGGDCVLCVGEFGVILGWWVRAVCGTVC